MGKKRSAKSTSGFIYIWFDKKRKRYYIGSHWGTTDDGYICSSNWMRDAYKKRPEDFKRRIIKFVTTSRQNLLTEEARYLAMIKDHELKTRYYNLAKGSTNHWYANEDSKKTIREKISASVQAKYDNDPEYAAKRKAHMAELGKVHGKETAFKPGHETWNKGLEGQEPWNKGIEYTQIQGDNHWTKKTGGHSEESKEKNRQSHLGKKMPKTTGENHWRFGKPKTGKSAAERQRDYRERQKLKQTTIS